MMKTAARSHRADTTIRMTTNIITIIHILMIMNTSTITIIPMSTAMRIRTMPPEKATRLWPFCPTCMATM